MIIKDKYDRDGNPFGVFCSNADCPLHQDNKSHPDPLWSEDCPEKNGVLVCPHCGFPVTRPL